MDHPLISQLNGLGIAIASLLSIFNSSSQAQVISGLTARQSGASIVLDLASVLSVNMDDLNFYYSEDGGANWHLISGNCMSPVSSHSVQWDVLACLGVETFTGNNIRFKASASSCNGNVRFNGYDYRIVKIGDQCWFAENLRTEYYANGDPIPGNLTDSEWTSTTSGAQAIYGEGNSYCEGNCEEVANLENYGRLYNWYAVDDSRGLCPSGWHVPLDGEWTALTDYLGGSSVAGTAMKSSPGDSPSWNGTNTSGFSALPGGLRNYYNGYFYDEGSYGYWWSASPNGASYAWYRFLLSGSDYVVRNSYPRRFGFSVRCLRDE